MDMHTLQHRYDYIIAGAGAAGLTLLWYLLNSDTLCKKNILLLDQSLQPTDSKTWCFWDNGSLPVSDFYHCSWNKLSVSAYGNHFSEELKTFRYHCIRSYKYSSNILEMAAGCKNVTVIETGIRSFSWHNHFAVVHTDQGDFSADIIFQSVLQSPGLRHAKSDITLQQHFLGWEIESDRNVFDPDSVTLMDFNTRRDYGFSFFYVLPFAKNRALIEYTLFSENLLSQKQYENELEKYIAQTYNLTLEEIVVSRTEFGVIPMEDRQYEPWYCRGVLNIGTAGGWSKPSTGYTFTRIHKQIKRIITALEHGNPVTGQTISPYRFRVYDIIILYLLKHEPNISVKTFHDLFKYNKFDTILKFLDEDTAITQELIIFSTLRYMPFFKSIYKMKHRIFTGV